jgi:sterol desaturase/sphingolipid hydroxylase (fatty acid hydroxylase superfamily)
LWNIHKHHHRGKNYAVKSLDAHPIEHLWCNLGSITIGIEILRRNNIYFDIFSLCLWVGITTINTCLTHSEEYNAKGNHLIHHRYLNHNYGVGFYFMDKLMGTYKQQQPQQQPQ